MIKKYIRLIRRSSMVVAVLATLTYLLYRGFFTLNLDSTYACCASLSLYIAEIYGALLMFLYFFQIWELVEPTAVPPLKNRSVDVFIPTFNEDPELLRGTISAAVALDYPHKTYVLDDGSRPAVRELASELGAEYIKRDTNLHAKAGNLNHAMEITDGEFVVIFDADHVSRRDFITRLIGYFADERLGFVQTPHSFYNFDNFHGSLHYGRRRYWEEGELFYNLIQPGKNYWNAVSFCGSAAMLRREALEDVGLVATETITEDMHTGLRMHARGWNSLFVNERLVSGQAAADVTTFNSQRLRWGEGNLGVFAYDNPLTMRGLTIGQRIGYLGSMLSWTTGVQKLQLYLAPMLMLLTGVAPVSDLCWTLAIITIVYMLAIWTAVTLTSNGHGHLLGTELTHMASFWTQIRSTYRAIFKRRKTKFVVTAKRGRQTNKIVKFIAPHCIYIAGSALAIAWAGSRSAIGLGVSINCLAVGSGLLLVNCWFAWEVVRRALRSKQDLNDSWRHPCALHVAYSYRTADGQLVSGQGVSCDLNEGGVGLHAFEDIADCDDLRITLSGMGLSTSCAAIVRHKTQPLNSHSPREGNAVGWRYGLEFSQPTTATLAVVWRLCSDYATARLYDQFESRKGKSLERSIETALQNCAHGAHRINLPIALQATDGTELVTVSECLSARGCGVLLDRSPAVDQVVRLTFATPLGDVKVHAKIGQVESVILGATAMDFAELHFESFEGESRSVLQSLCSASADDSLGSVVTLRPPEKRLPSLRPAMLTGSTAAAAALLAVISTLLWHQDELLLSQAGQAQLMTPALRLRLDRMVDTVISDPNLDEKRLIKLREILTQLSHESGLAKVNALLMQRDVGSFTAKLCRAQSLDAARRFVEASQIYTELIDTNIATAKNQQQNELLLSAARNAANCQNIALATQWFGRIEESFVARQPNLLHEYAGLLAAGGQMQEAIALLVRQPELTTADRFLVASYHASAKEFQSAIEQYQQVLEREPGNVRAMQLLADNALGAGLFDLAIRTLRTCLHTAPHETATQEKLAFALLWNRQSSEAIELFEQLLLRAPQRADLRNAFVDAAASVRELSIPQAKLLSSIASEHSAHPDNVQFTESLVNALSNCGRTSDVLPLLQQLVETYPQRMELRLRLVDLLETVGDFATAESHLQVLLAATSRARDIPTGQLIAETPRETSRSQVLE